MKNYVSEIRMPHTIGSKILQKHLIILVWLLMISSPILGQIRVIKLYQLPYKFLSSKDCPEALIDSSIILLFQNKVLINSIEKWEVISRKLYENNIINDTETFNQYIDDINSLRKNNYYLDYVNVKSYIIHLPKENIFFVTKLVNCNTNPTALFNKGCALAVISIYSENNSNLLVASSSEQELALQSFKANIIPVIKREMSKQQQSKYRQKSTSNHLE